jgi:hypothetical protein
MSNYPIYRRNEPRSLPSEPVTSKMTEEEMIRVFGSFAPARDSGGKVIRPPAVTPYKTKGQKVDKPKKESKHEPYVDKYPQVTKEFVASELAAGKKLFMIGEENGMSRALIFHRAEKWGLHTRKKQVRGAGK